VSLAYFHKKNRLQAVSSHSTGLVWIFTTSFWSVGLLGQLPNSTPCRLGLRHCCFIERKLRGSISHAPSGKSQGSSPVCSASMLATYHSMYCIRSIWGWLSTMWERCSPRFCQMTGTFSLQAARDNKMFHTHTFQHVGMLHVWKKLFACV
jgi:hypothetical protein